MEAEDPRKTFLMIFALASFVAFGAACFTLATAGDSDLERCDSQEGGASGACERRTGN